MLTRVVAGAVVAAVCGVSAAQGPPAARVRFDEVRQESVERQRQVTGQLRASRAAQAASREEGRVVEVVVDVGDLVEAGQPLVRLDDTIVRLELVQIEAELEALERTVEEEHALAAQAELDVQRLERAVTQGGVSSTELENAESQLAAARARASRAEADVAASRATRARVAQRLEDMVVSAPFGGSVVAKLTEVGEWVDVGAAVAEIVELSPIDAWLEVPERYIAQVQRGATISVRVESVDVTAPSEEVAVVARANELARTFPVRVRLANPEGVLKPGMSVSAELPTGVNESVLTVSKDALLRDDAGTFVYFDAGGMAMPARVERLWGAGDRVVVRSDMLRAGMRVVTEGNERMFPSQPLIDIDAAPTAEGEAGGHGRPASASAEGSGDPARKGG